MRKVQQFAENLCKKIPSTVFTIEITYNPGKRSEGVSIGELFVARPCLQVFNSDMNLENARFDFKHRKDMLTESSEVFGSGPTANKAFTRLLQVMAGKDLVISTSEEKYHCRPPKDLAK